MEKLNAIDLRIVEHLDMQKLPESVQQMISLASTPEEQDIILMATLAAASACVPNMYFRYGPTGKKYYANLQCFILAAAASGKGIANQALEMVRVIDEQHPMLIAGDSTLAAWYKALEAQGGVGYMHESEGSVITDIWKASAANYNTALRKAAEHEAISRNRVKGASEIKCPRLSMLLTGTFGQYKALVPSVENGYFSRLLTVVIRGTNGFDKRYVRSKGGQSAVPQMVGNRLLRTYEALMEGDEREWSLTDAQKERLGEHLETEYATLIELLGDNFHSAVIRMAVQIERIAMPLCVATLPNVLTPTMKPPNSSATVSSSTWLPHIVSLMAMPIPSSRKSNLWIKKPSSSNSFRTNSGIRSSSKKLPPKASLRVLRNDGMNPGNNKASYIVSDMIVIKNLHDDIGETGDIANIAIIASTIFAYRLNLLVITYV